MLEMFYVDSNVVPWNMGVQDGVFIPGLVGGDTMNEEIMNDSDTADTSSSSGGEGDDAKSVSSVNTDMMSDLASSPPPLYMADDKMIGLTKPGKAAEVEQEQQLSSTAQQSQTRPAPRISFMDLPMEIRLQIYGWVYQGSPMRQKQLCDHYPTPTYSAYFLQAVIPGLVVIRTPLQAVSTSVVQAVEEDGASSGSSNDLESATGTTDDEEEWAHNTRTSIKSTTAATPSSPHPKLLSPHRSLCYVPHALLTASRQVYSEARLLPFHENEFVFVNWFASGLPAARAFVRGMSPWQRSAMRFARLEMRFTDVYGGRRWLPEFVELCGLWADGLRGLRLKMEVGSHMPDPSVGADLSMATAAGAAATMTDEEGQPAGHLGWIDDGLRQLSGLRFLEIELPDVPFGNDKKLQWCSNVEERLNAGREPGCGVRVLCVARTTKEQVC